VEETNAHCEWRKCIFNGSASNILQTLKELVDDGWLIEKDSGNRTYIVTPRLRRIIASQKLAKFVPISNHDLNIFAGIAKLLKKPSAGDENEAEPIAPSPRTPASTLSRRRSAHPSVLPPTILNIERQDGDEDGDRALARRSPSVLDSVVVQTVPGWKKKKSRLSDPGPVLAPLTGGRRPSGMGAASTSNTPTTAARKRAKSKRRVTMAVIPKRESLSEMPSGQARVVQYVPLIQALSRRTQRALRRNALSEEMNNIHAEESAARRKHREELARLKQALASSQQRLGELERELLAAKHAASEEPEHRVGGASGTHDYRDQDVDMDMGGAHDYMMDCAADHADDTPEPEDVRSSSPFDYSPPSLSRQSSSLHTPRGERDQRVRDLEAQIASLREDIARRAEEAERWQEEAELFHDAEEQILIEENKALAHQIEELQSPSCHPQTQMGTVEMEERVEVETVVEESIFNEGIPVTTGNGSCSVRGDDLLQMDDDDEEEPQPDPRIADLEAENERLQRALKTVNSKIKDLEEEVETSFTSSEELRQKAERSHQENDTLRNIGDKLAAKIRDLEELEGERLENVADGGAQTDSAIDEEKEAMECKIIELETEFQELQGMHTHITMERRQLEVSIAELRAHVESLNHAVEVGTEDREKTETRLAGLQETIARLEEQLAENVEVQTEMEKEAADRLEKIQSLEKEVEDLRQENARWQEELVDKDKAIGGLTEQLKQLEVRVSDFISNVASLEREIASAKNQLEEKDQEIENLEGQRERLREELESRNDEIVDLQSEKSALEVDLDQLETQIETVRQELGELRDKIADKDDTIQELSEARESALGDSAEKQRTIDALAEEKADLAAGLKVLESEIQELQTISANRREEVTNRQREIDDLIDDKEDLENELHEKEQAIEELQQRNSALTDELRVVNGTAATLEHDKMALTTRVKHLESNVEDLSGKFADLGQNNINLSGQLAQRAGEMTVLEKKVLGIEEINNALRSANELLQSDKSQLEAVIRDLEASSLSSEDQRQRLLETITRLEGEITVHENAVAAADKARAAFEKTIAGLLDRITSLEKASKLSQTEKESLERDIGQLEIRIAELKADLESAIGDRNTVNAKLLEAMVQIETFKQAVNAAATEREGMERQVAQLYAEVEASKKAIKVLKGEKEDLEKKIEELEADVEESHEVADALKTEKELMRREISERQARIAGLEHLLEVSQADNAVLRTNIEELRAKIVAIESSLEASNFSNQEQLGVLNALQGQIDQLNRQAKTAEEEQSIIAQKIQPYINGLQPLDMAVDEVLTELVIARTRALESEGLRRELEAKIRILAQDASGTISPEEVVEKLKERFKDVRKRVENLFVKRQALENSPFAEHQLGDCSNDHALEVLGVLIEELDEKLLAASQHAKVLQSKLDTEKDNVAELNGYLDEITMHLDIGNSNVMKNDIPAFVEKHIISSESKMDNLVDKLKKLEEEIERKDDTIRDLEDELEGAQMRKSGLDKELAAAHASDAATRHRLSEAHKQIKTLNEAAEADRMEIDELGQKIVVHIATEQELRERLDQQAASHVQEIGRLRHEKLVSIAAVENKLAEAILGKSHLESRLQAAMTEHASRVSELEDVVGRSREDVATLNGTIIQLRGEVEELTASRRDADNEIAELKQELYDTAAQSEMDIAVLQSELDDTQKEAAAQREDLEGQLSSERESARRLQHIIEERAAEIEGLSVEIEELKRQNADYKQELESKILGLEHELQAVRYEASKEKVRLELIINERAQRVTELEAKVVEYQGWLRDAEEKEAQLGETLLLQKSEHQLYAEQVVREKALVVSQKDEVRAALRKTESNLEQLKAEWEADNVALRNLVDEKKQQIESLRVDISTFKASTYKLEERVTHLEAEKQALEEELETEREKGLETFADLQIEVERFYSRFGDRKGQYVREQKLRASKKRSHGEANASSSMHEEYGKAPLSPASTNRVLTANTNHIVKTKSKRRRINGDSGIGVEQLEGEDDEAYEGSMGMLSQ